MHNKLKNSERPWLIRGSLYYVVRDSGDIHIYWKEYSGRSLGIKNKTACPRQHVILSEMISSLLSILIIWKSAGSGVTTPTRSGSTFFLVSEHSQLATQEHPCSFWLVLLPFWSFFSPGAGEDENLLNLFWEFKNVRKVKLDPGCGLNWNGDQKGQHFQT